jgi:hypothetical protein
MPQYVEIVEVVPAWTDLDGATKDALTERELYYPSAGADGQTRRLLENAIEQIATTIPTLHFCTLIHERDLGPFYGLMYPYREDVRGTLIEFATHPSGDFLVDFEAAGDVTVSTGLDVDDYVAFIEERLGFEIRLHKVELFDFFPTVDLMKDVLTLLAAHLKRKCEPFIAAVQTFTAAVQTSLYACTLEPGKVTIQPLWPVVTDETLKRLAGPERIDALLQTHFPQPVDEPICVEVDRVESQVEQSEASSPESRRVYEVLLAILPDPTALSDDQRASLNREGLQPPIPGRALTADQSIASWLTRAAEVIPDFRGAACVADPEIPEFNLVVLGAENLCRRVRLQLSASAGRFEEVSATWASQVRFYPDQNPHALVAAVKEVGADASVVEGEFVLASGFDTDTTLETALALVAGSLHQAAWNVLVHVGPSLYLCQLSAATGVEIQPLWLWTEIDQIRVDLGRLLPQNHPSTRHVSARAPDTPAELDTALTSGSLASRIDAAAGVFLGAKERSGRSTRLKDPVAWRRLARALTNSANQGAKCERVRRYMYDTITTFDVPEQESYLRERMEHEPVSVRIAAYPGMVELGYDSLLRYVNQRFCEGDAVEQRAIGQVLWRSDRAVELLVREHLAPASEADPALERRIVELFQSEHIKVQRRWAEALSPNTMRALAPLLEG